MLFRCKSSGARIQRGLLRSEYDHIGMVLRFDDDSEDKRDEVYILEATGNCGVAIQRWSTIRKHYGKFYTRIVLRHINTDRTDE